VRKGQRRGIAHADNMRRHIVEQWERVGHLQGSKGFIGEGALDLGHTKPHKSARGHGASGTENMNQNNGI
jgi:hypothetical protein